MSARPRMLLLVVPVAWSPLWLGHLARRDPSLKLAVHARDEYAPEDVDYVLTFRPEPGLLKTLPSLKVVFSLGAGVDGILSDPDYPKHVPLVRFVDDSLSIEMAQYVVLHTLMHHRRQREFDAHQAQHQWRQSVPPRATKETRIGVLGMGEIGGMAAKRLRDLGFPVAGWSRGKKHIGGVESFAGEENLDAFLARSDILICLLPLTPETRGILNVKLFAALPQGAYVINVARGAHLVEADLIAALNSGHLSGATLDVFANEPLPPDSPLWTAPNVTITPHVAAITDPQIASDIVIAGIARIDNGKLPDNVVDPAKGY